MDSSGFLSPKANAFSIAHLIDASQLSELFNVNRQSPIFGWDSQNFTRDMEGIVEIVIIVERIFRFVYVERVKCQSGVAIDFGMIGIRIRPLVPVILYSVFTAAFTLT